MLKNSCLTFLIRKSMWFIMKTFKFDQACIEAKKIYRVL